MKKSELLKALQDEIGRHSLATFWDKENGVTQVGCDACLKVFGTNERYKKHLCEDVLPGLLNKLFTEE